MEASTLEVADVLREFADVSGYVQGLRLTYAQKRVVRDLVACRTPPLGLHHIKVCDHCSHKVKTFNSCSNINCPKCGAEHRAKWLEERSKDLLPVPYYHGVFTLPDDIAQIALQNPKVVYKILFRATSDSLKSLALDPRYLGAHIGFTAVLHTCGQTLMHHPHIHLLIPGGGLSLDGSKWVSCTDNFFLPVQVLSAMYRDKFLDCLKKAYREGALSFSGRLAHLIDEKKFGALCEKWGDKGWVVYLKPPFAGPKVVLKYLARYTNRVAISNRRLLSFEDGKVSFSYKDYAQGNEQKVMTLDGREFIRRFLMHVLPKGFMRIRHYGLLSNSCRAKKLVLCRELLAAAGIETEVEQEPIDPEIEGEMVTDDDRCPACGVGTMIVTMIMAHRPSDRQRHPFLIEPQAALMDSS